MKLEPFRNSESGPGIVLGNGPSLDRFDVPSMSYPTVGCNRTWRKIISTWHCVAANDNYFREIARGKWKPRYVFIAGRLADHRRTFMRLAVPGVSIDYDEMLVDVEDRYPKGDINREAMPGRSFALTGILAIQVAWYLGFNPIYLIAFDGGSSGHFKAHERAGPFADSRNQKPSYQDHEPYHRNLARALPSDVKVFNCNRDSQIKAWPFVEMKAWLK